MGESRQSVAPAVTELDSILHTSSALIWHLKAVKGQTGHAVRTLLGVVQPDCDTTPHLAGSGLE